MIDAAVLGRVGVDLYPEQTETPLAEVTSFARFVGGFAGNVATGLARLGVRVAIVSRVGAEGNGEFVRTWLAGQGVDVRYLVTDPYWLTPLTFCEIWPPDHFPLTFYRTPTAPDWQLSPGDFDRDEIARAPLLYATGTALARSPSRETTLAALRAHTGTTIFDLDWRPTLWQQPDAYPALAAEAAGLADIVLGNEEEVDAANLQDIPRLVLKRGANGATVFDRGAATIIPGTTVAVVNGLGAGDAFAAALGHALLGGLTLTEAARRGAHAGAIVASRLACSEAMPTRDELERIVLA